MEGVGEVAGGWTKTGGRRKEGAAILLSRRLEAQSGRGSEAWLPPPRPLKLHCLVQPPPPPTHTHPRRWGRGETEVGRDPWQELGGGRREAAGNRWECMGGGENWRVIGETFLRVLGLEAITPAAKAFRGQQQESFSSSAFPK